jgi:hypothetical protein
MYCRGGPPPVLLVQARAVGFWFAQRQLLGHGLDAIVPERLPGLLLDDRRQTAMRKEAY